MINSKDYFWYRKRYLSVRQRIDKTLFRIKFRIIKTILTNKLISKYLDPSDKYYFSNNKHSYRISENYYAEIFSLKEKDEYIYEDIYLESIDFLEVIEIDNFDQFRKNLISKFAEQHVFPSIRNKEDIKERLSKVKSDLDTISSGGLLSLNFSKRYDNISDLISFVEVSYTKTYESYFILRITISPSKKFKTLFSSIIKSKDVSISEHHYLPFFKIIKAKRFHSHQSIKNSLKFINLEGLLNDLEHQVKINLTNQFNGYFSNSKRFALPRIEYYEVDNISKMHSDLSLNQYFYNGFAGYFSLADKEVEIFTQGNKREDLSEVKIVKQKGHGKRENTGTDYTEYDKIETFFLLKSLAFPCAFQAILNQEFKRIKSIKRNIYDFVVETHKWNVFRPILLFYYNNKYIKLKKELTRILLTTKRFETEFTKQNIHWFTHDFNLTEFISVDNSFNKHNTNLLLKIINDISSQLKKLERKTKDINEIFKSIEELNTYRTNYILQITSLIIGLLAFIFTFDKFKNLLAELYNFKWPFR